MDHKEIFKTRTARVVGIVGATLGTVSGLGWLVDATKPQLASVLIEKVQQPEAGLPLSAGTYTLAFWPTYILLGFSIGLIALVVVEVLVFRALRRAKIIETAAALEQNRLATQTAIDQYRAQSSQVVEEYRRGSDALKRVVRQLYNPINPSMDPTPRFNFKSIECEFVIDARGDTQVRQSYVIETADQPGHFWHVYIAADEYAAPFDTLRDIHFRAESKTPSCSLEPIPTNTRSLNKEIAIFFLPEVPPQSSRAFEIAYVWRGWFGEMFDAAKSYSTNWLWSYKCQNPSDTASVKFSFKFSSDCGRILCENMNSTLPGDDLSTEISQNATIWTYTNKSAPVGRLDWDFKFSKGA